MTRSAADAGAMLGVIAGLDPNDPTTLAAPIPDYLAGLETGVRGLRIGIDTTYNEAGVDADIVGALREARRVLEGLGASIREVKVPDYDAVAAGWGFYAGVEAAIVHAATYPARSGRL